MKSKRRILVFSNMMMYADKYADAVSVTIVASTEPVVTLLAAVLLPEALGGVEEFSTKAIAGAVIISLGAIVAGTNFLSKKCSTRGADGDMAAGAATNSVATVVAVADAVTGAVADAKDAVANATSNEAVNAVADAVAGAAVDAVAGAAATCLMEGREAKV